MNTEPSANRPASSPERLQKVLAAAGFGSRRACEELILAGRVSVDQQAVTELGIKVDPERQEVYVDSERIRIERKRYFLLCKPRGVVCTSFDPANRPKAIDLVPKDFGRLFTVGRLDEHSEGLLLVTNDGDLAERLAHPRYQVERRYRVLVAGQPTSKILDELKQGIYFTEGKFRVRDVRRIQVKGQSAILEVTLTEGQNREIRRLFARVGHKVMALIRVAFGPLTLGALEPGKFRELSPLEVKALQDFAAGKPTGPAASLTPRSRQRRPGSSSSVTPRSGSSARKPGRPPAKSSAAAAAPGSRQRRPASGQRAPSSRPKKRS